MAKRTRFAGRSSGRRPGANRLVRREAPKAKPIVEDPTARPTVIEPDEILTGGSDTGSVETETGAPASARGIGLSQVEIDRAAQLEAEMTVREKALEAVRKRGNVVTPVARAHDDVNQPLAVRAAHEYAYVARDVRRIVLTGALMIAILAVLDVLVNVLGVITL